VQEGEQVRQRGGEAALLLLLAACAVVERGE
jgi:hypothetical protein